MIRNPLIPFAIIAVLGIILTVGISYYGLNNADKFLASMQEKPAEGAGDETTQPTDPEGIYAVSCAACHGQNLDGGMGPELATVGSRLSADEIVGIINNGQGAMPPVAIDAAAAEQIAGWLAEKK